MIYKLVARAIQYFCFPERPMKGRGHLGFLERGNLRKGGYDSPYYGRGEHQVVITWLMPRCLKRVEVVDRS